VWFAVAERYVKARLRAQSERISPHAKGLNYLLGVLKNLELGGEKMNGRGENVEPETILDKPGKV
jgi:hypothetical protein